MSSAGEKADAVSSTAVPRLAICMATYNPPAELFRRQIDSLRAQTFTDWVCYVSDDSSDPDLQDAAQAVLGDDPRFVFLRNPSRLGFYRNFERSLRAVPADVEFVALCDQDDYWYPEKLTTLIDCMIEGVSLAYADVRTVTRDGDELSPTYWQTRENNYTNLAQLLVANTVTGAASLFRADLLPLLLPFPAHNISSFHDHWIACTALSVGRIAYVDRPLHDYVQHGSNVIGHAKRQVGPSRVRTLGSLVRPRSLRRHYRRWQDVYTIEVLRIRDLSRTILERAGDRVRTEQRVVLERFAHMDDAFGSAVWLAGKATASLTNDQVTMGAERRLFAGVLWSRLDSLPRRLGRARASVPSSTGVTPAAASADFLNQKIAPIKLQLARREPPRVNLLIPNLDLDHFFGGYIGKLNLAVRLARLGFRVRIIAVDWSVPLPEDWRQRLSGYEGLGEIPAQLELVSLADRSVALPVHPDDAVIATTWWTAHIANEMCQDLGRQGFLYLIQEYEPFTFAQGSLAALAEESYDFPHAALFSTGLLREYFAQERIGVFGQKANDDIAWSASFDNAITPVRPADLEELSERTTRRLLFYARPEAHAARNMFETGVLALREAVERGFFGEEWEFYGIGASVQGAVELGSGQILNLLPRQSQARYAGLLRSHDLGLSLMHTPHPSLVPLEMASAGMVTVTNTYANKTEGALLDLSTNFVPVAPTVSAVADGLREAVARIADVEGRLAGAKVSWSTDWGSSLPESLMSEIGQALRALH